MASMNYGHSRWKPTSTRSKHTCRTVTSSSTPDPFIVQAHGKYYFTFTARQRIEIWSYKNIDNFEKNCRKEIIWTPPPGTEHTADLRAPELHPINGRWYIYYSAADPAKGNKSHRMYVLGGPPVSEDPSQGQWQFLGRITGMPDTWAIDGTVFELDDGLYMMWSGWPEDNPGDSDLIQQLCIQKLELPTIAEGEASVISWPQYPWEFSHDNNGAHGILEGPQFLSSPDERWRGIVYSCAGSWTMEYKLAVLHYNGGDPLDPQSWPKGQEPLLQAARCGRGPFGPGHGNFMRAGPDTICVFHGTDTPADGWNNRKARRQRVQFTENGPYMGQYCGGGAGADVIGGGSGSGSGSGSGGGVGGKSNYSLTVPYSTKSLQASYSMKSLQASHSTAPPYSTKSLQASYSTKSLQAPHSTKSPEAPHSTKSSEALHSTKSPEAPHSTKSPEAPHSTKSPEAPHSTKSPEAPHSTKSSEAPHSTKSLKSSGSSTGHKANENEKEEVAVMTAAGGEPAEKKAGLVARIRRRLRKRLGDLKRFFEGH